MNRKYILRLTLTAGLIFLLMAVSLAWYRVYRQHRLSNRGRIVNLDTPLAALNTPRYAVNVALQQYEDETALRQALDKVREAGFSIVRQEFPWSEIELEPGEYRWTRWDAIMRQCEAYGLKVIAVLDTSPGWARSAWEADNTWAPPVDYASFAGFSGALAARYHGTILAYQVWDMPNISPHWGKGEINPQGYVNLLRAASTAIRANDTQALIVAGGMAPTVEQSLKNMSDVQFLREINRRGAAEYYDVLGIRTLGFWSGPDDRVVADGKLNFSRAILLREEQVQRGLGDTPIWSLDSGWCALPTGWQGADSPSGNDTEAIQATRLSQALDRMEKEWPWLGLMSLQHLQPDAAPADPIWGYSLLSPSGEPRTFYTLIKDKLRRPAVAYPGISAELEPLFSESPTSPYNLTFFGTDLELKLAKVTSDTTITLWLDELDNITVTQRADKPSAWHSAASRLSAGLHSVQLGQRTDLISSVKVINRPEQLPFILETAAALIAVSLLLIWITKLLRELSLPRQWAAFLERLTGFKSNPVSFIMALLFTAAIFAPSQVVRLLALAVYGGLALVRPHHALYVALFSIPFAPIHTQLGPGSFSMAEVSLLVAAAAQLWNTLLATTEKRPVREVIGCVHLLDIAILLLIASALASTLLAEYQRVAWREFRVVVLDSAIWYALIRLQRWDKHHLVDMAEMLVLAGAAVALYALIAYLSPTGVVVTEGVRRARAFYGSPNNLALILERILPLAVVFTCQPKTKKRWFYLAVSGLVLLAIVLSFSRGALILGLPAITLVLFWLPKGKWRWLVPGFIVLLAVVLLPVVGAERFTSLLDPTRGTTFIRLGLWRAAWQMALDHPLTGVGLDNFLYYYGDYIQPGAEVERFLSHPHNILLDFWLRLGLGGLVTLALLGWGVLRRVAQRNRISGDQDIFRLSLGFLAGLAAMLMHGLIDTSYFVIELAYWFTFACAWLVVSTRLNANASALTSAYPAHILDQSGKGS